MPTSAPTPAPAPASRPDAAARPAPTHPAPSVVIAIDGPSGSGKSTVARRVASRLGLRYLDTGAMYRAVTWRVLEDGVDPADEAAVATAARGCELKVGTNPRHPSIAVDGVDVSRPIRSRAVTNAVSAVSAVPDVRRHLVARQHEIMGAGGIVVEGRDIGTVVAPDAPVKVFLTASARTRAERRHRQLTNVGEASGVGLTEHELERRDARDAARATSPLAQAPDAHVIDSTGMSVGDVVHLVLARCAAAGVRAPADALPRTD